MKKLLPLLFLFINTIVFSQDPILQNSNERAEQEAIEITNLYIPKLALTGKQQLLFENKVEEFLIRRYEIDSTYEGREKLDLLYKLQEQETTEMNNIITQPQMNVYRKVKPSIQPLETVKKKAKD